MTKGITEKKGLIFDVQRYSLHDGPGIRTVVFFKGCPLRCKWCANPESLSDAPVLNYNQKDCLLCQRCISACTQRALSFNGEHIVIDRQTCTLRFDCVEVCASGALNENGKWYTVDEVMDIVQKDAPFYKNSGGGITLSGGEVLQQSEFAAALLKKAKAKGIHTAIETSGYSTWESLESVLIYTDLVLYDIKHTDDKAHMKYTGVSNALILENLKKALDKGKAVVARIPIIPSVNSSDADIESYVHLLNSLEIKTANILPFHQLGLAKYEMLGMPYPFKEKKTPTDEFMERIRSKMQDGGIDTKVGG